MRARITSGEVGPGGLLPAEGRVAAEFGVGRDTARAALADLRAEGLISMTPQGPRVRAQPEREEFSLQRGSRVVLRMPTPAERAEHDIADGVPAAVVRHGARTFLLVGDRVELVVK